MSRKPHLVAMTQADLIAYKERLLYEHVSVLLELQLRERRDEIADQLQDVDDGEGEQLGILGTRPEKQGQSIRG